MKKKFLSVLLVCLLLSVAVMSLTVSAAKEKFMINTVSVMGYHPPLLSETAGDNIGALGVDPSAKYTLGGAKWYKYNSFGEWVVMGNNEKFLASTNYYLEFTIVKKSGYSFSNDCVPYVNDNTFYTDYYSYGVMSGGQFVFDAQVTQANTGSLVVNGYTGDTVCSECGITVKKGTTVTAKGHKESDWIIDKAASSVTATVISTSDMTMYLSLMTTAI